MPSKKTAETAETAETKGDTTFLAPAQLMKKHGLSAKKSFGQCFLHDRRVVQRIVEVVDAQPSDLVVEIGAGLGALTSLLAQRAGSLVAIERDRDLVPILRAEFEGQDHVTIVEDDALSFDYSQFSPPAKVVGNLPYNISSPLLFRLLEQRRGVQSMTIMLQRELAERLNAAPGSRLYGAPTLTVANLAELRICFHVRKGAFVPAPAVDSTVLKLIPRPLPLSSRPELFRQVVRAAFSMRRKMVKRALSATFAPLFVERALNAAGISKDVRAETISLEGFIALTDALALEIAAPPEDINAGAG
ncbi:MAG: ribosomal RNA small subunit methyltransferase A [Deltaproteobacteria bacterium]|nr:ribosomal RNA small subunit methyltransferase A [Deltaproteobacteria bacterium]